MRDPNRRRRTQAVAKAVRAPQDVQLDLAALTLAIWLAVVVAVTGFTRLSADAQGAAQAAGHAGVARQVPAVLPIGAP